MIVTGYTDSKLSQITTYDLKNPYKVGVNGVTDVIFNSGGTTTFITVKYNINGIDYQTELEQSFKSRGDVYKRVSGGDVIFTNGISALYNEKRGNTPNYNRTEFKSYLSGFDFIEYPAIKDEKYLGQVFTPEIKDEIFIERTSTNVFERHSRLEDINNIVELENYKNGFFNVKKV